jgi:hypothetical protein
MLTSLTIRSPRKLAISVGSPSVARASRRTSDFDLSEGGSP